MQSCRLTDENNHVVNKMNINFKAQDSRGRRRGWLAACRYVSQSSRRRRRHGSHQRPRREQFKGRQRPICQQKQRCNSDPTPPPPDADAAVPVTFDGTVLAGGAAWTATASARDPGRRSAEASRKSKCHVVDTTWDTPTISCRKCAKRSTP